jgi:hypothetical protein
LPVADTTPGFTRLPQDLRDVVRIDPNGEVAWPRADAPRAVEALAAAGCVVLGLDLRAYDEDKAILELAWTSFDRSIDDANPAESSRAAAFAALRRADAEGFHDNEWVLVTWQPAD